MSRDVTKTEDEWRSELTPEQFEVMRRKGTEAPFSGDLHYSKEDGSYRCAACEAELFDSRAKFDSGTGWPSFTEPAVVDALELYTDASYGMIRIEVLCRRCGGHLGHVFDDGPRPGGKRYCINSVALCIQPRGAPE